MKRILVILSVLLAFNSACAQHSITPSKAVRVGGRGYLSAYLATSPMLVYRCAEQSGTTAIDSAVKGNAGTYSASGITYRQATPLTRDNGASVTFDGTNGTLTTPSLGLSSGTVVLWFNTADNSNDRRIYAQPAGGTTQDGSLRFNAGDIELWNSPDWRPLTTGAPVSNNVWYHLAVVYSGGNATCYLNGVVQQTVASDFDFSGTMSFGNKFSGAAFGSRYSGKMTEIAVCAGTLTANEIYALYAAGRNGF